MSHLKSIYETCRPRADVPAGTTKDEQFAADLAQVVNNTAPKEYADPSVFCQHSYPTRGMQELLKAVLTRLTGRGGEIASIIRLHTQYGGGKTHRLISLVHAVRGMPGVERIEEFLDPALLPRGTVRLGALDGENTDPADGLTLEGNLRAKSLWGELAYRLAPSFVFGVGLGGLHPCYQVFCSLSDVYGYLDPSRVAKRTENV
jgi:predicted AAA+ superfamily ATPase